MLADDEVALVAAHGLRGHDLVGLAVLKHAVLMDAGLMGKGVGAHDGLVVGDGLTDGHGEQAAGRIELLGDDAVLQTVVVLAHAQGHGQLFEGGVARALADAADGHLGLTGTHAEGGQGVGHGQAQVVVAVHAEDGLVAVGRVLDDVADEVGEFLRLGIAHGVGQVDGGGAGLDGGLHHAAEEVTFGTGGVLGGELHVVGVPGAAAHPGFDHLQHHFGVLAQLVLHVQGRSGKEGMDAGILGVLHGLPAAVDVAVHAAAQAGHLDGFRLPGDTLHGLEIPLAGGGKTGFHNVHAQHFELVGNTELFLKVHGRARRLFAVTQGGVEKEHAVGHGSDSSDRTPAKGACLLCYCITAALPAAIRRFSIRPRGATNRYAAFSSSCRFRARSS